MVEAWSELQKHFGPKDCVVLQEHCSDMISESGCSVSEQMEEQDGGDIEPCGAFGKRTLWGDSSATNTNLCRFEAPWRNAKWLTSHWSDTLAKYEYSGVEAGLL